MLLKPDLRDFRRMPQRAPMRYHPAEAPSWCSAQLIDLSASGVAMLTADALSVGALLVIEIVPTLALVPPLKAVVEVRRCEPNDEGFLVGVRFIEMQ